MQIELCLLQNCDLEMNLLLEAIHSKYNYDFRRYSVASMKRRLVQAMSKMECETLSALQEKVLHQPESFYDLLQFLTIPVSELFRNPSYFHTIREKIVPILKTYPSLKVWVAGCSTGEEVYSLAILFDEEGLLDRTIFYATDINPRSLSIAERGIYGVEAMQKATSNFQKSGGRLPLSHYYTASFNSVKLSDSLKKHITFADHSLVTDSVFSEMQFISCRNVLIYFNQALQNHVYKLFDSSLCRKGFLGLGPKETVTFSESGPLFSDFAHEVRIFQKI